MITEHNYASSKGLRMFHLTTGPRGHGEQGSVLAADHYLGTGLLSGYLNWVNNY